MAMKIEHEIVQGSDQWHAWRASLLMASDAPAMMGVSPYKSRNELLQEKKFGITGEINPFQQKRFDDGHRFEELARPYAEKVIGSELYPICGSSGIYGASLDGLTMDQMINWEHKTMNDGIRAANSADDLPMVYHIQVAHQCMVSGADRALFSATRFDEDGNLLEEKHLWIEPNQALIDSIKAGWAQFQADLEVYVRPEETVAVVGKAPDALPALRIEATGMVLHSNLAEFAEHAITVFRGIKKDLVTDEDFADAEKTAKWCDDVEKRLEMAKQQVLGQTSSIDDLFRAIDAIKEEARQTRLDLEKMVKAKKDKIKAEIVSDATTALQDHINALNLSLGGNWLPKINGNFAEAAKNKRTVASLRSAVSDALANARRDTAVICSVIAENRSAVGDDMHLFPDFASVCVTKPDVFVALVESRRQAASAAARSANIEAPAIKPVVATTAQVTNATSANDIPSEFGGNVDPVIQNEGVIATYLNNHPMTKREHDFLRAHLVEFVKYQAGYRKAA